MKVRSVTVGLSLTPADFSDGGGSLRQKLARSHAILTALAAAYVAEGFEVQTVRVAFNAQEEWLPSDDDIDGAERAVRMIDTELASLDLAFCSLGCASSLAHVRQLPRLLAISPRLYASAHFAPAKGDIVPPAELLLAAAAVATELHARCGTQGNFRYTSSFNCAPGNPFFPVAYHRGEGYGVSIALECGDLLFLAFHGAESPSEGCANLEDTMRQALTPVQRIASTACAGLGPDVVYKGIDASINPGLTLPDSVGAGIESLLPPGNNNVFGAWGTLAAVSAVTRAIKNLAHEGRDTAGSSSSSSSSSPIVLAGYSGLMMPVMEDVVLAERAARTPPTFTLRDLLTFSSVCGVGLDTVPVPADTPPDAIAAVYTEVAAMAFRLDKPLSCRLLLFDGTKPGDLTSVTDNPYIVNTRVFAVQS